MKVVRRMLAPVIIGCAAVAAYVYLSYSGLTDGLVGLNEFYGEQFFSVIATLYAIITALILVKGIESFDALSSAIGREAMKIRSINSYLYYFAVDRQPTADSVINIRRLLVEYLQNILQQNSADHTEKNDEVIDACLWNSSRINPLDENDRIALQEVMRGIDDLRALRSDRVNCSRAKLPGYLIWMLVLMTMSIILPFYLETQKQIHFNHYIIFTLSTFASFIYFLLQDINRPYDGLWSIDLTPFREAIAEIQKGLSSQTNS